MAKKKQKKQSFADRHPVLTLIGMPLVAPVAIGKAVADSVKECSRKYDEGMSGIEYEKYVASRLLRRGFKKAEVTPGSGDFGADIVGKDKHGRKVCVQCKKYQGSVGVSAVQEVIAATRYYKCDYGMVITTSTFTPAAKKMAAQTGVILEEGFI
jgi:restriction system protein